MDRSSVARPVILTYSRRIASELRAWLLAHGAPGTILAASSPEEARESIEDVDILFGASFPTELFPFATHLRWIQSMNAGVEELVAAEAITPSVTVTRV